MTESTQPVAAPGQPLVDAENPWPGPEAFHEADAAFFFGRDRARNDLARLLLQNRLVILYGRSGLGKTSLLRAGVFPLLRDAAALPIYVRLAYQPATQDLSIPDLRTQVRAAIEAAVRDRGIEAPALTPDQTLWEWFYRTDARFFNERSRRVRPVLVFDQFEEAFTLGRTTPHDQKATDAFLDEIVDLVRGSMPTDVAERVEHDSAAALQFAPGRDPCGVLLALRQEFLADLLRLRSRLPSLLDHRFELSGMTVNDARLVVEGAGGHLVEAGVPERIATFVATARRSSEDITSDDTMVDPAILSIFCNELNATRRARGLPRITQDLVAGTKEAIIAEFYNRRVEDEPLEVHRFIESRLVTDSGYRDSATVEEAVGKWKIPEETIEQLIDRRLLAREGRGPRARLELTHDVLVAPILQSRKLRSLRDRETEERQAAEDDRRKAEEVEQRARSTRDLRRQRMLLVAAVVALAIMSTLAWATFTARANAETERLAALSNLASANVEQGLGLMAAEHRDRGLAYIAGAVRVDPGHLAARSLVFDALLHDNWPLPVGVVRHGAAVLFAEFDSTGTRIVTASEDRTARIWSTHDQTAIGAPLQHGGKVFLARFGPMGHTVLTLADDGYARVWDADTAQELKRYANAAIAPELQRDERMPDDLRLTAAAIGAGHIATGALTGTVRIWTGDQAIVIQAHRAPIVTANFDQSGARLVTADVDGSVAVWDSGTGRRIAQFTGHRDAVVSAEFAPDGRQIATASRDGTVRVWRLGDQKPSSIALPHNGAAIAARFSPDGMRLLTAYEDGTARLWNASTGEPVGNTMRHADRIVSASFSPEGRRILTASSDSTASLWSASDGAAIAEPMHVAAPMSLAMFSPDGQHVVTASSDGAATIWDVRTGAVVPPTLRASCDRFTVRFASAREVAAVCSDGSASFWDSSTGEVRRLSSSLPLDFNGLEFSSDGKFLAATTAQAVTILRAQDGSPVATCPNTESVTDAEFASDSELLLTVNRDGIHIWDVKTGALRRTLDDGKNFQTAHFSDDGSLVVGGRDDGTAKLWHAGTGVVAQTFQPKTPVPGYLQVGISRDLQSVLTYGQRSITVWDVKSGKSVRELPGVNRVAVSSWIASAGDAALTQSDSLQLWQPGSGRLIATLIPGDAVAAAFSRDGRRVAIAHRDGHLAVWDVQTGQRHTEGSLGSYDFRYQAAEPFHLSPDGQRGISRASDGKMYMWDVPSGARDDGAAIATVLEAIVGYRLNSVGGLEAIDDRVAALSAARTQCGSTTSVGAQVCRWALGDRGMRTISPFSSITIAEYIRQALASGYPADRDEAQRLFPWDEPYAMPAPRQ